MIRDTSFGKMQAFSLPYITKVLIARVQPTFKDHLLAIDAFGLRLDLQYALRKYFTKMVISNGMHRKVFYDKLFYIQHRFKTNEKMVAIFEYTDGVLTTKQIHILIENNYGTRFWWATSGFIDNKNNLFSSDWHNQVGNIFTTNGIQRISESLPHFINGVKSLLDNIKIHNKYGVLVQENHRYDHKLHKDDGPAVIRYNDDGTVIEELWYKNGKRVQRE